MRDLIISKYPETQCEKLVTKHPEHYSAFKIVVDLHHFDEAIAPENFPYGCYVSRYFRPSPSRVGLTASSSGSRHEFGEDCESSILCLNVCSLNYHKTDEIAIGIDKYNFNFVCLAETWCRRSLVDTFSIADYVLVSE